MSINLDVDNLPKHVAVIMDGNGRWAKKKGAARIFGHKSAIKAVRETTEGCAELGVQYLTLYAFSTENWGRPKKEVDGLMELLVSALRKELSTLTKNNIRLHTIGDTAGLPKKCQRELQEAIDATKEHDRLNLILALNYSGRWEITKAMRDVALKAGQGGVHAEDIDEEFVKASMNSAQFPDPELLIRTSGELRVSNFMLWQLAYSELYFTDVLWPDFRKEHLKEALAAYQARERRFGKTSEQVKL